MTALLIVHHSPTRSMQALTDRLEAGAHDPDVEGVDVAVRSALDATAEDLLAADGYVLATPANFGYMSGGSRRSETSPTGVQAALRFRVAHVPSVNPGQQTSAHRLGADVLHRASWVPEGSTLGAPGANQGVA